MTISTDYLFEMKTVPLAGVLSPAEAVAFTERLVLPTFDALAELARAGRIVAGGPIAGAMAFTFVLRAASPAEAEEIVTSLPLWPRTQSSIVPLGSFARRAGTVRTRLAELKASAIERAAPTAEHVASSH